MKRRNARDPRRAVTYGQLGFILSLTSIAAMIGLALIGVIK